MRIAIRHNAAKPSAAAMRTRLCEKVAALGLKLCEGDGADVVPENGASLAEERHPPAAVRDCVLLMGTLKTSPGAQTACLMPGLHVGAVRIQAIDQHLLPLQREKDELADKTDRHQRQARGRGTVGEQPERLARVPMHGFTHQQGKKHDQRRGKKNDESCFPGSGVAEGDAVYAPDVAHEVVGQFFAAPGTGAARAVHPAFFTVPLVHCLGKRPALSIDHGPMTSRCVSH